MYTCDMYRYTWEYTLRQLTFEKQVNAILKTCHYNIRNIASIRCYITRNACKTLYVL